MNKLFLVRDIIGLSLLPFPPFPPLRFRFASKIPLHLYPESPPKLHPNVQLNAPAPRIESRIFLLLKAQGDGASNSPHHLKVANPSASVAESSPARAGAQRSEREKGGDFALRESRTVGSGTPLVPFVVKRKEPGAPSMARPCSRGAPAHGECRGATPLAYRATQGPPAPAKSPLGNPPTKCKPKPTFNRKNKTGGKPYGLQTGRSNDD